MTSTWLASKGLVDGTPRAIAILAIANDPAFDVARLRAEVRLSANAAAALVVVREGDSPEKSDDETFETIAELDKVPYTSTAFWEAMIAYVDARAGDAGDAGGAGDAADAGDAGPAPGGLVAGEHRFSGCVAHVGTTYRDRYSSSYVATSTDGYYSFRRDSRTITVRAARPDGTAEVTIEGMTGGLRYGTWNGYTGGVSSPNGDTISVSMFHPGSHLRLGISRQEPRQTFPDGSWSERTNHYVFHSNGICGLRRL